MTAGQAKEILELNVKEAGNKMPPDVKDALILACEDFDRLLRARSLSLLMDISLLPSETLS